MAGSIRYLLCLSLLLTLPLPASAFSVTFVNPGKKGERFWDMVTETMQAAADDLQIELEVIYAQRNRVTMSEIGIAAVERDSPPDYLILVNEEQAAEPIVVAASQHNIPTLMLLNDFLPEQLASLSRDSTRPPNLLGAITPDNFGAGQRMMEALISCAERNTRESPYHILAIGGDSLTPASIERNRGAMAAIEANSHRVKLDRFLFANWNKIEARSLTGRYLGWAERNRVTPAAIWAANDPIARGANDALQMHGLRAGQDVCLAGLNWSADGLRMLRSGEMVLTDGGHFLGGAWSLVLLHDYHQRKQAGDTRTIGSLRFPMQAIDQSNIEQYTRSLGDEKWSRIDFRRFTLKPTETYSDYQFSLQNVLRFIDK